MAKKKNKCEEPYVDFLSMHEDLWNDSGKTREEVEEQVYGLKENMFGIKQINYPKGHPKWRG
tara:strand:- start:175 stop:360 length:186 start_codon:yes stop_codon:yes gene_type:complete